MRCLIGFLLTVSAVSGLAPYYRDAERIDGKYIIVLKVRSSLRFDKFYIENDTRRRGTPHQLTGWG